MKLSSLCICTLWLITTIAYRVRYRGVQQLQHSFVGHSQFRNGVHTNLVGSKRYAPVDNLSLSSSALFTYNFAYHDSTVDDSISNVFDSAVSKVSNVVFNPLALVITTYILILGFNKLKEFLSFSRRIAGLQLKESATAATELPHQVFECEQCGMQMRPAKGRSEKIFGRKKFRCARCGAKASSYFNINNMNDARAKARLDRIELESQEDDIDNTIDDWDTTQFQ